MFKRKLGSTLTNKLVPVEHRVSDAARVSEVELAESTKLPERADATLKGKLVKSVEAAELLLEMWTALQGIRSCLETWEQDLEWANTNPDKAYIGSKSEGLGKRFALHQFRHRVNWDDLEAITKVIRRMEQEKIAYRDQVDKRGYREL